METIINKNKEKMAYSVEEVSKQTTLSVPFLRTEIRAGHLRVRRFGSRVLILNQDLMAYLQKQEAEVNEN